MLVRMVRSVDLAEEIAQQAFVDALEGWGESGVPDNPGAWLMTAARHRAIDVLRHNRRAERKHEELAREIDTSVAADFEEAPDDVVGDDLLRLVFIACHPVLPQEARVALTLRLLGGLGTDEIARAFLVAEPTVAQRITRAKRTLAEKKVPFELPSAGDLTARLGSVLCGDRPGPYFLQAAIAACHARAKVVGDTDWTRIAALYETLAAVEPSPVVELNRAVAVGMACGPEAGLEIADALRDEAALREYPFLPSVRADLLAKLGRYTEATTEVVRAAELTKNERDRELFLERAENYRRQAETR
jgi:RNA polymerase sigma factor (sigma-70 family)